MLEGKRECFLIFYDVNMSTKSKTDSEFSYVSFSEIPRIPQTASKYFTLVGARFSWKPMTSFFCSGKGHKFAIIGKPSVQTLVF